MKTFLERERKWDVDDGFEMPPLQELLRDSAVHHDQVELTSEYFDTADRDLQTHGVTLRRRSGQESGWQLKVPSGTDRLELHFGDPSDTADESVPAEVARLLTGLRIGKELTPVARIHTVRDRYRIVGVRDQQLHAPVADDRVDAIADGAPAAWREIEIELGPEEKAMPKQLVKRLASAGAAPSAHPSKLSRVAPQLPMHTWGGSAATQALAEYVHTQIDAVFSGDLGLRRGQDPIHDTRVAIRRLRSTLRVFSKVFDEHALGAVESDLKWFAGLLGEVRDCEVQRRRFADALAGLPDELVLGPVAARIDSDLHQTQLQARSRVSEAMDSPRYLGVLALLHRWRTDLPMARPAKLQVLRKRARRAGKKADKRLRQALAEDRDDLLHAARKAAKRARYAAELVAPVADKSEMKRDIKRFKHIQSVLGDHQDSVVAAGVLQRLARVAGTTPGENGFTFGLLYANERQTARRAVEKIKKG